MDPPTWNIGLQRAPGSVIPGRLRVSVVLLDHINIRLMGADGPTEACEDQQSGRAAELVGGAIETPSRPWWRRTETHPADVSLPVVCSRLVLWVARSEVAGYKAAPVL